MTNRKEEREDMTERRGGGREMELEGG